MGSLLIWGTKNYKKIVYNTMKKFEYITKTLTAKDDDFNDTKLIKEMNKLGQDGWEIVTVYKAPISFSFSNSYYNLYCKREIL